MDNNRMCIICRKTKDKSEFNEEHIIPESLGNKKLTINCVCKECNEKLGSKVDSKLTNNILTELYRFEDKIKGKSGKLPNPFKKGLGKDGTIIHCDENLKPTVEPNIKYDEKSGKISVNANTIEDGIKIVNKKLKRLGKPCLTDEQIIDIQKSSKTISYKPDILIKTSIDSYELKMALIKIAYEFVYYIIGDEYLNNEQSKRLSKILNNYIYNNEKTNLNGIISHLPNNEKNILQLLKKLGNKIFENENIHSIYMCSNCENKLIVQTTLFTSLNYGVVVSNKKYNINNKGFILNPKNGELIEF
ncbi:HNH endonuclease [Clostridium tyrobutyricum]|uniref:HNH endonuclease n=1 Tax=Clostridium tyrobutyricum TaxID=1519 RepID=UPI001C38470F|nr:HNH endonuclease [Clostridium tyrobutyricum]MBV4440095.1 HNH endonuclease [Clostridium tyrobutyricum]